MAMKAVKNKKIAVSTLAVSLVVAFLLIKGVMQQPKITENKEKIDELNEQIALQEQKLEELDELKEKVNTDEYIEKVAREHFGYIKENEIIFYDVSGK